MAGIRELLGSPEAAGVWRVVPEQSTIGFMCKSMWGLVPVKGRFKEFSGDGQINGGPTVFGRIDIKTASLETGIRKRDQHLRSADFFEVEKYPTATFRSTGVRANGDDYVLDGEFTLKGVTKPVSLDLEFNGVNPGMGQGEVAGLEASVVLNRKDFGIDIDMPLETGGAVVGDKITITLEIEALKQA